jgi:inosine triphosphate pyrophosphatase
LAKGPAFITGNQGKFKEVAAIIPDISQLALDLDEIQSLDAHTIIEHKLAQAAGTYHEPMFVEDTSLVFHCLGQLPGPLIKFFEDSLTNQQLADLVSRYDDNSATARSTIGYRDENGHCHYFSGEIKGTIVSPRGELNPFGWNNIFQPQGHSQTFAEMTVEAKNAISMRGIAATRLRDFLSHRPHM